MVRIKDLPVITSALNPVDTDVMFLVDNPTAGRASRVTLSNLIKSIGYPEKVLEKCPACGQWGAVMCECPKCGHPIDPKA